MKHVRVRYAPSPTGLLHIGNARSALFNYLFARHYQGDFIIRIEDTDVLRNVKDGVESQLKYLKWLGINWDEGPDIGGNFGPYFQLQRLDLYRKYAHQLLEMGLAYKDYKPDSEDYAIRFKIPQNKTIEFNDMMRGKLSFESKEIEDWIILKDNGIPTYNFAVVIDDHFMEITHVLRGEEHITNTPKQIMIYEAFNWFIPEFGHMTIIVNENRKKLSKRDKGVIQFIGEYQELGYLPEAMFNFISLLGWSATMDREILSQAELINLFDEKRLSKSPALFDKEKLSFINSKYIKALSSEELATLCRPFLEQASIKIKSKLWLDQLLSLFQDRLTCGSMITALYHQFFHDDFEINDELLAVLKEHPSVEVIEAFAVEIQNADFKDVESIESVIKVVQTKTQVKGKSLYMPLRIATTQELHGPSLPISILLLGKTKVLKRLRITLKKLKEHSK